MLSTLALALILQAPAPKAKAKAKAAPPSPARAAELRSTAQKRKADLAAKKAVFKANRAREAYERAQWQAYVERVGPIIAMQQREAWRDMMEAQRTAAMVGMAQAAQADAITNRARLRQQAIRNGAPQMYVPGQGVIIYPGSIQAVP